MTTIIFDEAQHPREAAGRFTDKAHTAPEAALLAPTGTLTEAINDAYPIPQANSLEKVSATVSAVAADVTTPRSVALALGVDDRQGAYYLGAAGYLGLVEHDTDFEGAAAWRLTALGEHMTRLEDHERAALLAELAESTPAVAGYRENGEEGAADAISEVAELGDETIGRRAATAASWAKTIDAQSYVADESRVTAEARENFALAAAAARDERAVIAARAPKVAEVCQNCFTEIPASGTCGSFTCV
ncbi:hypothetical protein [Microbacterium sp. 77mftsu3.1]|uniref:DUF7226 domain-containing protein n=1 Tax=Microbacterium sp. 77mftsu3.1 TaxID=1761802 RepID=UPI00037D2651|nr:hypothetical protein [Microbacterium sp. 77mftsu3.1]